jgi:hypothetical protein
LDFPPLGGDIAIVDVDALPASWKGNTAESLSASMDTARPSASPLLRPLGLNNSSSSNDRVMGDRKDEKKFQSIFASLPEGHFLAVLLALPVLLCSPLFFHPPLSSFVQAGLESP